MEQSQFFLEKIKFSSHHLEFITPVISFHKIPLDYGRDSYLKFLYVRYKEGFGLHLIVKSHYFFPAFSNMSVFWWYLWWISVIGIFQGVREGSEVEWCDKLLATTWYRKPNNQVMFMPQLVPFYFINQLSFGLILLSLLIYLASKRLLPQLLQRFISRIFITLA